MRRYLVQPNRDFDGVNDYDVIIVGTGIAGLFTALNISGDKRVLLVTKDDMRTNNSYLAQGGIAVTMHGDDEASHISDSLKAGGGYNEMAALEKLVSEGESCIEKLIQYGVDFDRDPEGHLLRTREGGHSERRILHQRDMTGKAIIEGLIKEVASRTNIEVRTGFYVLDLLTDAHKIYGVVALEQSDYVTLFSESIVLATGGIGEVYGKSTNAMGSTADGMAMALRAGVKLKDMEFIQFHPTALDEVGDKYFLISEAVRGEGGILVNDLDERFMEGIHKLKELAPRDVVAKAINDQFEKGRKVYLDVRHMDKAYLMDRFPTIYNHCLEIGIDISKALVPITPVQHYIMGGIETDLRGQTSMEGLYACGETARTGVHGANRLASNSLLEGVVFGNAVAMAINGNAPALNVTDAMAGCSFTIPAQKERSEVPEDFKIERIIDEIHEIMTHDGFIIRNESAMAEGLEKIQVLIDRFGKIPVRSIGEAKCLNMLIVSKAILQAAKSRKQSLGSHIVDGGETDV